MIWTKQNPHAQNVLFPESVITKDISAPHSEVTGVGHTPGRPPCEPNLGNNELLEKKSP